MKIWECEECGHATSLSYTDEDAERAGTAIHEADTGPGLWHVLDEIDRDAYRIRGRAALDSFLKAPE